MLNARREYGVVIDPEIPQPQTLREDLGAQFATGLVTRIPQRPEHHGNRSTDFTAKREGNLRTQRFLSYDGRVLRFQCVEANSDTSGVANQLLGSSRYALYFYLADETVEMRMLRNTRASVDDATLILKKTRLPKNWREVKRGAPPVYYTVPDLLIGSTVDCYGRVMLLIHCDEATRKTFQEIGIDQTEIKLPTAEEVRVKHPVPQRGDLFLPIGSEEDTLGTVYGMPKQTKDYKKLEEFHNKVLRARVRMVTDHHVDRTRVFLLSYFLEDDTLQLFEEQQYNGGVVGGNFLKRGRYVNTLPGDSDAPRNFRHSDIYLGNVFCCSGCEFQIVEMDGISLTICESYPELFPLFDAFKVALRILPKVQALSQDLRAFLTQRAGTGRRGSQPQPARWMTRETLLLALEATGITRDLNDQELLTLIRRVKDTVEEKYFYQELCDLFVHLQFVSNIAGGKDGGRIRSALAGGRENNSEKEYFLRSLRGRKTQWRRYTWWQHLYPLVLGHVFT